MEIKPQELRLTNLVEWNKEACTVQSIRGNDIGLYDRNKALICTTTKLIKPIELTPEWLERFGFDNSFLKLKTFYQGQKTLTLKVTVNMTVAALLVEHIDGKFSEYIPFPIKHVHQLQNLYFALTGEELAIDKTFSQKLRV